MKFFIVALTLAFTGLAIEASEYCRFSNFRIEGMHRRLMKTDDEDGCSSECTSLGAECFAYMFQPSTKICEIFNLDFHGDHNGLNDVQKVKGYNIGYKKIDTASGYCTMANGKLAGRNPLWTGNIADAAGCGTKCSSYSDCIAYAFTPSGKCSVYNKQGFGMVIHPHSGYTAGFRQL